MVDDNPDHLEVLSDLLKVRGYEVVEAHDATQSHFRAITTSVRGHELCSHIQESLHGRACDLRPVFLTFPHDKSTTRQNCHYQLALR